jgi:hypothetical protein
MFSAIFLYKVMITSNWVLASFFIRSRCLKIDSTRTLNLRKIEEFREMSYIIWSRKCKKCKGQFYLEDAEDGHYLTCIQCGYSEKIIDQELVALMKAIQPTKTQEIQKRSEKSSPSIAFSVTKRG